MQKDLTKHNMMLATDKALPSCEDTERILIGDALLSGRLHGHLLDVAVTDFYNPNHAALWSAICELHEENEKIDVMEVWHRVRDDKKFTFTIIDITNTTYGIPGGLTAAKEVKRLRELALKRKALKHITALQYRIFEGVGLNDVTDELESIQKEIAEMRPDRQVFVSMADVLQKDVYPRLDKFVAGEGFRFPTGFDALDNATLGGIGTGELWVIAALTGGGKSALALQMALHQASCGIPTAFVSREMLNYENAFRALSQLGRYSNGVYRAGMHAAHAANIRNFGEQLEPLPIFFDDKTADITTLKRNLASLIEKQGVKVIYIDYLQLLNDKSSKGRQERLEWIVNELKAFAMTHEVSIVLISQFNRQAGKGDAMPTIYDLDGASAIEKARNVIIL